MANYIKPTFSLTANKNSVTSNKGPLSIALSLATTDSLTVDDVRSRIVTVGTSSALLFDGDQISGGDGAGDAADGGGGASGYNDGSITIVDTQQGGSTDDAKVIL